MSEPMVKSYIPDAWAAHAHCIFCGFSPLVIERIENRADRIKCSRCNLSIELDETGRFVRPASIPQNIHAVLPTGWLSVKELTQIFKNIISDKNQSMESQPNQLDSEAVSKQPAPMTPESPHLDSPQNDLSSQAPVPEELIDKVSALNELGNSLQKTREILIKSTNYTHEEIDEAIKQVASLHKQKTQKGSVMILIMAGGLVALCLIALAITYSFSPTIKTKTDQVSQQYEGIATVFSQQQKDNPPIDLGGIQTTQIAPGVSVFNVPTPVIEILPPSQNQQPTSIAPTQNSSSADNKSSSTGTSNNRTGHKDGKPVCPISSAEAAALFGSSEGNWKLQQGQWVLLDNKGANIYIPEGMSGGYLVIGSTLEMKTVLGPAKVSNIYMMIVTCDY